jgi:hypothetical protein
VKPFFQNEFRQRLLQGFASTRNATILNFLIDHLMFSKVLPNPACNRLFGQLRLSILDIPTCGLQGVRAL